MLSEEEINEMCADAAVEIETLAYDATRRFLAYEGKTTGRVLKDIEAIMAWTPQNDWARAMSDMGF